MEGATTNPQNPIWAVRLTLSDLQGWAIKRVDVPPDGIGIAELPDGSVRPLDGKRPAVGGWGYRLAHSRGPRVVAVGIVHARTLHGSIRHTSVLSYDGKIAETDWPVKIEVSDPVALYNYLIRPEGLVTESLLLATLASSVDLRLRAQVRQYTLSDLMNRPEPVQAIATALMPVLQSVAQSKGLKLQTVGPLAFLDMEERSERLAKLHALQQRLREEEMRDRILQIRGEHQLREFVENLEHETKIRDLIREDELLSISQDLAGNRLSPKQIASIVEQRIAEQARPPEAEAAIRARQLTGRLEASAEETSSAVVGEEKEEPGRENDNDKGLRWLLGFLRNFGMVVFWGTTLVTILWPHVFSNETTPKVITAVAGFVAALAAFIGADWVNGKIRERRLARLTAKAAQVLSAEEQQRADQLLRMNIAGLLRRSVDSIRAAKDTLLRRDMRESAVDLKQIENRVGTLAKQAEVMAPAFAAVYERNAASPQWMLAVVDVEEKILGYSETLHDLSDQIREVANREGEAEIRSLMARMESAIPELKNLFEDRSRLLQAL